MVRVSFVVTVYNKAPFLPDVIKAIRAQEGDFEREYVFVNDGSTDNSLEVVKDCTHDLDNVILVDQANGGVTRATNAGVQAATGDYIKLVDADDILAPYATALLLKTAQQEGVSFAFCTSEEYECLDKLPFSQPHKPEVITYHDALEVVIKRGFARVSHSLFKRQPFLDFHGCDERIFSQDHSLFYRFATHGPITQIHHIVCASPQDEPNRIMNNTAQVTHDSSLALAYCLAETPNLPPALYRIGQKKLTTRAWRWARHHHGVAVSSKSFLLHILCRLGWRFHPNTLIKLCAVFRKKASIRRPALADIIADSSG